MFTALKQLHRTIKVNPYVLYANSTICKCNGIYGLSLAPFSIVILKKLRDKRVTDYEQEFGDIRGLPAQNDFPSILSKH